MPLAFDVASAIDVPPIDSCAWIPVCGDTGQGRWKDVYACDADWKGEGVGGRGE